MAWRLECKTHFGIIWSNFITTVFNCRSICCCDGKVVIWKVVIRLVYFNNGFFHPRYCRQLPTSLEELLEYQWEQGAQFLMQQASQYDGTMWILHSSVTRIDSESVVAHEHQENIPHVAIVYFFSTICLLYNAQMLWGEIRVWSFFVNAGFNSLKHNVLSLISAQWH